MIFIRPITTLACGALGLALVAFDLIRSNVTKPQYADIVRPTPDTLICSSERLFEFTKTVPADEVSPDLIAEQVDSAIATLLLVSSGQGRALDWGSFRAHVYESGDGAAQIIASADVL